MDTLAAQSTPLKLGLPAAEGVGVWLVRATDAWVGRLAGCLSEEERDDIARLARSEDRGEAAVSRGLWRQLAGEALGKVPERVGVERTPYGRPLPEGLARTACDLSVSHTRGLVGVAAGHGVRLGIDLEHRYAAAPEEAVARAVEGISGPALDLVPDPAERQMLCWCIFESLIKADGRGMHLAPSMISAEIRTLWGWNMARVAGTVWWVQRLRTPAGYLGALAVGAPCEDLTVRQLSEPEVAGNACVQPLGLPRAASRETPAC
ncbi:MAG: hypothetical protein AAGA55_01570 [Planctomycetota bacterium]